MKGTEIERKLKDVALRDLHEIPDFEVPTETTVFGVSPWGNSKWGTGPYFEAIFKKLQKCQHRKNFANHHDALIGEAALVNNLELITDDENLTQAVRDLGGRVLNLRGKAISGYHNQCEAEVKQ